MSDSEVVNKSEIEACKSGDNESLVKLANTDETQNTEKSSAEAEIQTKISDLSKQAYSLLKKHSYPNRISSPCKAYS